MVCTSTQTYTVTIVLLYVVPRRLMWTPPTRPEMVSPQYVPPPVRLQWCHGVDINTHQRKYTGTIVFVYVVVWTDEVSDNRLTYKCACHGMYKSTNVHSSDHSFYICGTWNVFVTHLVWTDEASDNRLTYKCACHGMYKSTNVHSHHSICICGTWNVFVT
jgi:hypothetical protein